MLVTYTLGNDVVHSGNMCFFEDHVRLPSSPFSAVNPNRAQVSRNHGSTDVKNVIHLDWLTLFFLRRYTNSRKALVSHVYRSLSVDYRERKSSLSSLGKMMQLRNPNGPESISRNRPSTLVPTSSPHRKRSDPTCMHARPARSKLTKEGGPCALCIATECFFVKTHCSPGETLQQNPRFIISCLVLVEAHQEEALALSTCYRTRVNLDLRYLLQCKSLHYYLHHIPTSPSLILPLPTVVFFIEKITRSVAFYLRSSLVP